MLKSCSVSTQKQYIGALQKWIDFCKSEAIDYSRPNIASVLTFFTKLFKSNCSYSSLNTVRSAMSLALPPIEGFQIGSHPLVSRFLKAVGKLKPPKAKYDSIWDVNVVLQMFKSWQCNDSLSLKCLGQKLVALLAICTGQRVQSLSLIDICNIKFGGDIVNILIPYEVKSSKPGAKQPCLLHPRYKNDLKICPVSVLESYLDKTKVLRGASTKLFISYESPFNQVCKQTLARWLKCVLENAGVDITLFGAHSFRHASTSKARQEGVSIDYIYQNAGWVNNSKVFGKFYDRNVESRCNFSMALLNKRGS